MRIFYPATPTFHALAFTLLLSIVSIAQDKGEKDDAFTTKLYPASPTLFAETISPASWGDPFGGAGDPFGGAGDPFATNAPGTMAKPQDPLDDLAEMAELPEGSKLKSFPQFGRIMLRTSAAGHQQFKAVLQQVDVPAPRITVDFSFIEIPTNVVATSKVFQQSGSLDNEEVLRLFREGKARLLSMSKATTRSGVNVQVEGVKEIIYPTEFQPRAAVKGAGAGAAPTPPGIMTPGSMETREAGHILNVTPSLSAADPTAIYLALIPESAILDGWFDVKAEGNDKIKDERAGQTPHPVFRSLNYTGSLLVTDGETVVAFGTPDPDTGNPIYGLVTARLENAK